MNNIFRLAIFALLVLGLEMPNAVFGQSEPAAQRIVLERDNCTAIDNNRFIGGAVLSMYKKTWLQLTLVCPDNVDSFKITRVEWRLLSRRCVNMDSEWKCDLLSDINPDNTIEDLHYSYSVKLECSTTNQTLPFPFYDGNWHIVPTSPPPTKPPKPTPSGSNSSTITQTTTKGTSSPAEKSPAQSRRKREERNGAPGNPNSGYSSGPSATDNRNPGGPPPPSSNTAPLAAPAGSPTSIGPTTSTGKTTSNKPQSPAGSILRTESDGFYWFIIRISTESDPSDKLLNVTVDLVPLAKHGHISAVDWPLLPFYAVMFVVYALYMIVWLVLCCCYRKDILQIQYWITGVIFIGLLEKTVFLGEFDTLNRTGYPSAYGALVLGELLSCGKKALARLLVIIVSFGFGIVKPRLGNMLYKVLAMGVVYFIACSVEGLVRISNSKTDVSKSQNIANIVLSIIDVAICWWIFSSLVLTMKTLRLRRNVVKLSLYRHFTNTLIFSVLASVAFMIWTIKEYRYPACIEDWKELWVEQAFWHLLFSIVLLVIIILWRPSVNNQRYAYSHLQDAEDDESEEPMINTAHGGIKLRSKGQENGSRLYHRGEEETDEDLKWIEENIPTSLADSALPSMLDSDEEIALTQNELRKMH